MYVRPGTWDNQILRSVAFLDEYKVADLLTKDSVVVDIGAHIGSFSYLAVKCGVDPDNIWAYEAFPQNYSIVSKNLMHRGVHVSNFAVWSESGKTRCYDGPKDNTGGGNVFWNHSTDVKMDTISLDHILTSIEAHMTRMSKPYSGVSVMKIDCETSEFPILLSSKRLNEIDLIVGEYHETKDIPPEALPVGLDWTIEAYTADLLAEFLILNGFRVVLSDRWSAPGHNALGHFRAERIK
jgi:FkbM family methyltransferase